jgi:hypothetical protein
MPTPQKPQTPRPSTHKGWNYDSYFQQLLKSRAKDQAVS